MDDRPAREIEDLRERAERAECERDQAQREPTIDATNWRAEHAIPPAVVKRLEEVEVLLETEEGGVRYGLKLWATPLPTVPRQSIAAFASSSAAEFSARRTCTTRACSNRASRSQAFRCSGTSPAFLTL